MSETIPEHASAVVVGGGIIGCSVAYHLAKSGWQNVVLLERKRLTSGTTWHAAGLIAQLRATKNLTRLSKYSQEIYAGLEEETGVATGFRRNGSITIALHGERRQELLRQASMARAFGVEVEEISLQELQALYPHLNRQGVEAAVFLPKDGQGDPGNIALALAKGSRQHGAAIFEGVKVTEIRETTISGKRSVAGVVWQSEVSGACGSIKSDFVVNCAGMWASELGRRNGVNIPLQACEHFYLVTETIPGLGRLPTLRVPDEYAYYKEDAGKILLGAFEPIAKPWGMEGIPEHFCFDQLPDNRDRFDSILEKAAIRFPLLHQAGIRTFFNGPESFTPDGTYHLGETPEVRGYFVAAGFNSIGIQSAGGAGMVLAHWMEHGHPPFDLSDVDIRRMHPYTGNRTFLCERVKETLGLLYANHFPYRQKASCRGIRRTPFHACFQENGAVFGEVAGWERPVWFSKESQHDDFGYSWGRHSGFADSAAEHRALRKNVGLYDMSSYGKILVEGPGAEDFMNQICGANMTVPAGKIVYTQFLNPRGGIEADVTATRLGNTRYLVVTSTATIVRDIDWMQRHADGFPVAIIDMTASEAVLAVMGPNARKLLEIAAPWNDWSNLHHPFGTARRVEIGMVFARAHRISYVGELGWELYVSVEQSVHVLETLLQAGKDLDLTLCGTRAVDSCRMEKGFRHFGHEITPEDHVLEAGLGFAVDTRKSSFIGREAVLNAQKGGISRRMIQFSLMDPEPLLYGSEPIIRDGMLVGHLTSGSYGHTIGGAIGLGYVPCCGDDPEHILASRYEIEVAGTRFAAKASLTPLFDPRSERPRG